VALAHDRLLDELPHRAAEELASGRADPRVGEAALGGAVHGRPLLASQRGLDDELRDLPIQIGEEA